MRGSRRVVAAGYGGPENLRVQEVPLPAPGREQVLVSVRGAGVNAYDAKVYASPGDPEKLPMHEDDTLHSVTITGPFYGDGHGDTTYSLELDLDAAPVTVTAPD